MLGIEGDEAWKQGENWQKYMRNWRGLAEPKSRLKDFVFNLQLHAKNDKIKVDRVVTGHAAPPTKFEPNKVIDRLNDGGKVVVRAFYNEKGLRYKDLHTTNHGNPKTHAFGKNGEHAHEFIWDENENIVKTERRELTNTERKENKDIL